MRLRLFFDGRYPRYAFPVLAEYGTRLDAGVSVAEVSLKLVWEVIWLIKAGEHGVAYVLDAQDRVIAKLCIA
jgi:two-component system, NtrC family, sensor kinase